MITPSATMESDISDLTDRLPVGLLEERLAKVEKRIAELKAERFELPKKVAPHPL